MNAAEYAALPWTIHGRAERESDGTGYYLVTIDELPGFSVVGETAEDAMSILRQVLEEYLEAAIESGHRISLPEAALARS